MVDVLVLSQDGGAGADFVSGGHPVVGVDGLPDCEEAVDVDMVEPEDGVEGRVVDLREQSVQATFTSG